MPAGVKLHNSYISGKSFVLLPQLLPIHQTSNLEQLLQSVIAGTYTYKTLEEYYLQLVC